MGEKEHNNFSVGILIHYQDEKPVLFSLVNVQNKGKYIYI